MKQYQDERTLQVRNRIYAVCGRSLLLYKDAVFPHGSCAVHDRIYPYDSCARVSGGAHPPDGGGSGDRKGQPQTCHSPAAFAAADSVFPAQKRNRKREFFFPAAPCGLYCSVPCCVVSFFPCGEKTGGKTGKTL